MPALTAPTPATRAATMKITDVKTFLCAAAHPKSGEEGVTSAHWNSRNWCFVKIYTDNGIYGVGESSGWPRVIETAIQDLTVRC